jgi:hypothetical protein
MQREINNWIFMSNTEYSNTEYNLTKYLILIILKANNMSHKINIKVKIQLQQKYMCLLIKINFKSSENQKSINDTSSVLFI